MQPVSWITKVSDKRMWWFYSLIGVVLNQGAFLKNITVLQPRELVRFYKCWNPVSRVAHKFCNAEFTSNSLWTLRRPRARGPCLCMCLGSVESWILLYFPNRDWPWNLTLDPILAKKKAVYLARECFLNSFYFQQNNLALIYQASNYWIKLYLTIPDQASVLC